MKYTFDLKSGEQSPALSTTFLYRFSILISIIFFLNIAQISYGQTYRETRQAYEAGKLTSALENINQITDQNKDSQWLLLAGDVHAELAKRDSFTSEHVNKAAGYYAGVVSQSPENTEAHSQAQLSRQILWQDIMSKAAVYEEEGAYPAALRLLDKAKVVLPKKDQAYLLAGKLAFAMKNYGLAEHNFQHLVDSLGYDGSQVQAILNSLLAVSLMEDGISEAREVLEAAQQTEEDSIRAMRMKVALLISKGKTDYAEQWLDSLTLNKSQKAEYYQEMARQYRIKEELERSSRFYRKALEADSGCFDAYYYLAANHQQSAALIMGSKEATGGLTEAERKQALSYLEAALKSLEALRRIRPGYPLLEYTLKNVEETLARIS